MINYIWTLNLKFKIFTYHEININNNFIFYHVEAPDELSAEVFYEFYHIVDGKVKEWNQFKRDVPR